MAASKLYSIPLKHTDSNYLDVYISRTIDTVSWEVYYRVNSIHGSYNEGTGNHLLIRFNGEPYVDNLNVCAILIDGVGSQLISSGVFQYSKTNLQVFVEFQQLKRDIEGSVYADFPVYKVTYNGNGGLYNGSSTWVDNVRSPVCIGQSYTTYENLFIRDGYTFIGWKDQNGIDWTNYINVPWIWNANYSYDVTLYAQWAKEYILSYDANGGIGDSYEQKVIAGQTITVDSNTFTHKTDKYIGWCLKRNDNKWYTTSNIWAAEEEISENGYSKMIYTMGNSLTIDSSWIISDETSFSLCAEWAARNMLTFYSNNKTGEINRVFCFAGENIVIPNEVPTYDNHNFIYWTTGFDGTGDIYYPNDVVFIDADNYPIFVETGLYAQYINYNVYVYPDGTVEAVGFTEDDSYQGIDDKGILHMLHFIQHDDNNVQIGSNGLYAFAFRNKQKHDILT